MIPGRLAELLPEAGMGFHARDVEVVVAARRLVVGVHPGIADARRAAADTAGFDQHHLRAGLREAEGNRRADDAGSDNDGFHDMAPIAFLVTVLSGRGLWQATA